VIAVADTLQLLTNTKKPAKMAMSGIGVSSEVVDAYNEFKKEKSPIAFLIFKIHEGKSIIIDAKVMNSDVPTELESALSTGFSKLPIESDKYAVLRSKLLNSPPRYAAITVDYKTDTPQNKVALITWCGDNATVKERMLISSTKDTLVKKLEGANPHQASDQQELEYKEVCDSISKGKAKWN